MKKILVAIAIIFSSIATFGQGTKQQYVKWDKVPVDPSTEDLITWIKAAMQGKTISGAKVRSNAQSYKAVWGEALYNDILNGAEDDFSGILSQGGEENYGVDQSGAASKTGTLNAGVKVLAFKGIPIAKFGDNGCMNALKNDVPDAPDTDNATKKSAWSGGSASSSASASASSGGGGVVIINNVIPIPAAAAPQPVYTNGFTCGGAMPVMYQQMPNQGCFPQPVYAGNQGYYGGGGGTFAPSLSLSFNKTVGTTQYVDAPIQPEQVRRPQNNTQLNPPGQRAPQNTSNLGGGLNAAGGRYNNSTLNSTIQRGSGGSGRSFTTRPLNGR